jgi:nucleoprotein TPR
MDVPYLSGHLGLPETTLSSLILQPTADLIAVLLEAVTAKAHELETVYAEKLNVDIELEAAVHNSETRCQTFKATAEKALKEVEELRQKLREEGITLTLIHPTFSLSSTI